MLRITLLAFAAAQLFISCNNNPGETTVATTMSEEQQMNSIELQIARARSAKEKGDANTAIAIADSLLQHFPGQLDALDIKAEILKEQGRTDEALQLLEKAYALQPRDKETAYNLAYEYAEAKNPKALALTDTLIKYDKTHTVARAWYIKATYHNHTGNEREALRYYDSSNLADYNFLDTYLDKGQLLLKQKQYEQALRTFATGQKFAPGTAEFYFWVAKTQEAMGQKEDAKMNYERAFALDKSMVEARDAAAKL